MFHLADADKFASSVRRGGGGMGTGSARNLDYVKDIDRRNEVRKRGKTSGIVGNASGGGGDGDGGGGEGEEGEFHFFLVCFLVLLDAIITRLK